jgi:hypothetical protein
MNPKFQNEPEFLKETQIMNERCILERAKFPVTKITNEPIILIDHQISYQTQITNEPQILKASQISNETKITKKHQILKNHQISKVTLIKKEPQI